MSKNDPAFPVPESANYAGHCGMRMRDCLAFQIAAAILGQSNGLGTLDKEERAKVWKISGELCYEAADGIIACREST